MRKGQRVTASGLPGWRCLEGVVIPGEGAAEGREVLVWVFLSWLCFWGFRVDGVGWNQGEGRTGCVLYLSLICQRNPKGSMP